MTIRHLGRDAAIVSAPPNRWHQTLQDLERSGLRRWHHQCRERTATLWRCVFGLRLSVISAPPPALLRKFTLWTRR